MTSFFLPYQKATILIPSGPDHDPDRLHLFILLTNPKTADKQNLIVSISSYTGNHCDSTCLLDIGDHSFIKKRSFVDYARARIVEADKLCSGVRKGILKSMGPISPEVFDKITEGLLRSPRTALKIINFISLPDE